MLAATWVLLAQVNTHEKVFAIEETLTNQKMIHPDGQSASVLSYPRADTTDPGAEWLWLPDELNKMGFLLHKLASRKCQLSGKRVTSLRAG